jgi:rhamnogalacturonyl hydrolase YesR
MVLGRRIAENTDGWATNDTIETATKNVTMHQTKTRGSLSTTASSAACVYAASWAKLILGARPWSAMSRRCLSATIRVAFVRMSLAVSLIWPASVVATEDGPAFAEQLQAWGEESLHTIRQDFWLHEHGLYAERRGRRQLGPRRQPAFMWSAGVQLSALAAAAALNPDRHTDSLKSYADTLKSYWHEHHGIGGYDVQPNTAQPDRYYDDNAWIVLVLVETSDITGSKLYLTDAIKTFRFVISGEDSQLGGGIYWRENSKQSKNTCSNAPAIVAALRLYQRTQRLEYLDAAHRLYDWTCSRLQEPETGLFWDNVDLSGRVDRRRFTYNSALMIRANCLFQEITGDVKYLAEAQRIANAAADHWVDDETGAIRDDAKFAHMLLEAFLAVNQRDENPQWLELATKTVSYVHSQLLDENGHYPRRWGESGRARRRGIELIDQASAARAFFVVARAISEREQAGTE